MIFLIVAGAYVAANTLLWFLMYDQYDELVMGFQTYNFSFHERLRLALLLPGLPLVLLLVLALTVRTPKVWPAAFRNVRDATVDHWAIITTGAKRRED